MLSFFLSFGSGRGTEFFLSIKPEPTPIMVTNINIETKRALTLCCCFIQKYILELMPLFYFDVLMVTCALLCGQAEKNHNGKEQPVNTAKKTTPI